MSNDLSFNKSQETAYLRNDFSPLGLTHSYGENVVLSHNPIMWTELAKLSHPKTKAPELQHLTRNLYRDLLRQAAAKLLPKTEVKLPTRMSLAHPGYGWRGMVISPETRAISVGVARAGLLPAQVVYDELTTILEPALVRQDFLTMNRKVGADGRVQGVDFTGAKTGKEAHGAIVFIPDPMAATGSSMLETVQYYESLASPGPKLYCLLHLVVTPEYLRRMQNECEANIHIFAVRLDRGLSPEEVLETPLGTKWANEIGLNANDYIVPGVGGFGEVLSNCDD